MRPRFSLRWLMALVLLVALILFGVQMRRTQRYRLAKAAESLAEERDWRATHLMLERRLAKGRAGEGRFADLSEEQLARELAAIRETSENHRQWAEYSLALARWYENGASRPWQTLGEEPPTPQEIDGTRR